MSCKIITSHDKNQVSPEFSHLKNELSHYLMDRTQVINEIGRREKDNNKKKVCSTCANAI